MKKIFFALLVCSLFSFAARAATPKMITNSSSVLNQKFYSYPSGEFSFIDGCGNDVSASWSCNFSCSSRQIVLAIATFIAGYGCGNYNSQSYPY